MAIEVKPIVESTQMSNIRLEVTSDGIVVCWDTNESLSSYGVTLRCLLEEHVQRAALADAVEKMAAAIGPLRDR